MVSLSLRPLSLIMAMVVSNDISRECLERIMHDYMTPGAMVKENVEAQVSFSVILLVRGKSSGKSAWIPCLHI